MVLPLLEHVGQLVQYSHDTKRAFVEFTLQILKDEVQINKKAERNKLMRRVNVARTRYGGLCGVLRSLRCDDNLGMELQILCKNYHRSRLEEVRSLIGSRPESVRSRNEDNNLPLHLVLMHREDVDADLITDLVKAWPESVMEKDFKGRLPVEIPIRKYSGIRIVLAREMHRLSQKGEPAPALDTFAARVMNRYATRSGAQQERSQSEQPLSAPKLCELVRSLHDQLADRFSFVEFISTFPASPFSVGNLASMRPIVSTVALETIFSRMTDPACARVVLALSLKDSAHVSNIDLIDSNFRSVQQRFPPALQRYSDRIIVVPCETLDLEEKSTKNQVRVSIYSCNPTQNVSLSPLTSSPVCASRLSDGVFQRCLLQADLWLTCM